MRYAADTDAPRHEPVVEVEVNECFTAVISSPIQLPLPHPPTPRPRTFLPVCCSACKAFFLPLFAWNRRNDQNVFFIVRNDDGNLCTHNTVVVSVFTGLHNDTRCTTRLLNNGLHALTRDICSYCAHAFARVCDSFSVRSVPHGIPDAQTLCTNFAETRSHKPLVIVWFSL